MSGIVGVGVATPLPLVVVLVTLVVVGVPPPPMTPTQRCTLAHMPEQSALTPEFQAKS
jgi:hypothetical protein